jgi:hypothetical protein
MTELLIELAIAAALVVCGGVFMYRHEHAKIEGLQTQIDQYKQADAARLAAANLETATLASLKATNAKAAPQIAQKQAALHTASASAPAWAAALVPHEVQEALK